MASCAVSLNEAGCEQSYVRTKCVPCGMPACRSCSKMRSDSAFKGRMVRVCNDCAEDWNRAGEEPRFFQSKEEWLKHCLRQKLRGYSAEKRRTMIERRKLCSEAAVFQSRLVQAGLFKTSTKMKEVVREIGWEVADTEIKRKVPPRPKTRLEPKVIKR